MGWIRDLMLAPPERYRSFGQLSRALLSDPSWPEDMKIQERSLGTLLSKLDRGHDLTWLADRPDIQATLARLLKCSVTELVVQPAREAAPPSRVLRWNDLPYARSFDLARDELPPTIPAVAFDPARWDRTFWVAPPGSGRTLVGQWLAARGLARFHSVDRASEIDALVDDGAPVFIELRSDEVVTAAAPRRRLCVAGALPPAPRQGWSVLPSPELESRLPELVRWILSRFPSDTALDERSLLEWLRSGPLARAEADCFGSVLGLAGVLDRVGFARGRSKSVLDLARQDVKQRFDEAFGDEAGSVAWQRRNGVDVMIAMARRALTDSSLPFATPRTVEEWTALVPDEHKSSIDVEWLRVSMARENSSIRPSDVERAARSLSPGAFRIVRTFSQVGLLSPADHQRLVPAPRYLSRAVELEAERQLLDASAFEWGEALLRPHSAPRLVRRILARICSGDAELLSDAVELEASESPAYAVAVETAFRCAGLALLSGADLSVDALTDLWDATFDLSLRLPGMPPLPRVEHPVGLEPACERGAFFLAAMAMAESIEQQWLHDDAHERVNAAIAATLSSIDAQTPWFRGAYALLDRLRSADPSALGLALSDAPCRVLDLVGTDHAKWPDVALSTRDGEILRAIWHARGQVDPAPLAEWLYRVWERADCPEVAGTVLDPVGDAGRTFFASAPATLALRVLSQSPTHARQLVPLLASDAWEALCETPPSDPDLLEALADALPESAVRRWLDQPELRSWVWRRHAAQAEERLSRASRDGDATSVAALAVGAPATAVEGALDALTSLHDAGQLPAHERDSLRLWLHEQISARRPSWRAAYSLLARLEGA